MIKTVKPVANKTMDREDLFTPDGVRTTAELNRLINRLESKGVFCSSWAGTLKDETEEELLETKGMANRGDAYEQLKDAADDLRIPWYLYWEINQVCTHGPVLTENSVVLDAGGASSLFSCYLASKGHTVHSVDFNKDLITNSDKIARTMGYRLYGHFMDMRCLGFRDDYFDHAYSICVLEHIEYEDKAIVLKEIARCLKPGGQLSLTIDYKNSAPFIGGKGFSDRKENILDSWNTLKQNFVLDDYYELTGNLEFYDNNTNYLVHFDRDNKPYTFASIFLQKIERRDSLNDR